jgi:recombination associated protein RdgC
MPALSGSLTYARLFVDGDIPDDYRERFVNTLRLRAMKPLEADDDMPERSGFCVLGDPYELELSYERVFYNDFVNLGFRTDRWAIPPALLRANVREAETAYLEKKGRERLTKREKNEIKDLVLRQMRKQSTPVVRVIDLSWSLDEGIVRFFTHAQKPTLLMSDLFTKVFGLKLVPEAPYTTATRLGLTPEQEAAWDTLELTTLLGASAHVAPSQPPAAHANDGPHTRAYANALESVEV